MLKDDHLDIFLKLYGSELCALQITHFYLNIFKLTVEHYVITFLFYAYCLAISLGHRNPVFWQAGAETSLVIIIILLPFRFYHEDIVYCNLWIA